MPLYDFLCLDCGQISEILISGERQTPACSKCKGTNMKKMLSAHSSLSGSPSNRMPGAGSTGCCGSSPAEASGCAGPGSCCGKR